MSMPCCSLCCDTCDYSRYNTFLWGNFAYLVDGVEVPLMHQLAWCLECQSFAAVEELAGLEQCVAELITHVHHMVVARGSFLASLASALLPGSRAATRAAMVKAKALALRIEMLQGRDRGRCLTCGSTAWLDFDPTLIRSAYSLPPGHTLSSGFVHPGCGGEILVKGNSMRLRLAFEPKRYDADGLRLCMD